MAENFHLIFLISIFSLLTLTTSVLDNGDETVVFSLKKSLNIDDSFWKGPDPCTWTGVSCNNDSPQKIVMIKIGSQGFTGTLPATLGQLTKLSVLELNQNNMTGPIPSLAGLISLQYLYLGNNVFTSVPSDFFDGMSSLQEVNMDHVPTLSPWTVPDRIKIATRLEKFSAVGANIFGVIPSFFGDGFSSLSDLHLSFNSLEGGLPGSFSGSPIKSLWLNGQKDKLNGTIDTLAKMTSLTEVWLQMNSFSGPLPDFTGLTELRNFSVRDNKLTGPVPLSLINLPSLYVVNLTNNHLQGSTPMFATSKVVYVDMINKTNSFCLDVPGAPCDYRVDLLLSTLGSLGYPYDIADSWKGNSPCNSSWLGISCSRDNITIVNLSNKGLVGMISPNFSAITSLERLILANNNLVGTIPIELTKLPNLKQIDVSNNNLHGKVPVFRDGVVVITNGNPNIGKDNPSSDTARNKKKATIIKGVWGAVGSIVFGIILLLTWCYIRRCKQKASSGVQSPYTMVVHPGSSGDQNAVKITIAGPNTSGGGSETTLSHASSGPNDFHVVKSGNLVITIQVLRNVTNNFSQDNVLGSGGFGTVYKGEFPDGALIAVKRMERGLTGEKGLNEFKSEIAVLTKVRHRHLVSLQGYCLDENEKLLVYEYMPQGTLSSHLFHWKREGLKPLEWMQRLTIALDVARGVEYLHGLALQCFIHRDLKPSNILLGDDMRAKVADFGLVRLAPEGNASFATCLAGTFGYLAPEYAVTGRVTTKVDVYSFGIILMELITGRKALDQTQSGESVQLINWFRRMSIKRETFREAIDPVIDLDEETVASISTITELAGHCSAREPSQRPDMSHAVTVLSSLVELWKPSDPDSDDLYGIDPDMTLPQALKKWQALEGNSNSNIDASSSSYSFVASSDNTQTSIPLRPPAFADSFTSVDGR